MRGRFVIVAWCVTLFISSGATAKSVSHVMLRDNVSHEHRDQLLNKLQKITGWTMLRFTADGELSLEGSQIVDGSKSARNLLAKAISGNDVIVLEDASSRADVAFCRVVPGRWLSGNADKPDAYVVLIDFTDFEQIVGDEQARAAFDIGWAVLHELDHVVMNSEDADAETADVNEHIGECEAHINRMRDELGLPLRTNYFFTASALKADPNFNTRFVRLPFEQKDPSSRRVKRYWLTWDFTAVGGFSSSLNRLARSSADIF
jgi:hypothetical protein